MLLACWSRQSDACGANALCIAAQAEKVYLEEEVGQRNGHITALLQQVKALQGNADKRTAKLQQSLHKEEVNTKELRVELRNTDAALSDTLAELAAVTKKYNAAALATRNIFLQVCTCRHVSIVRQTETRSLACSCHSTHLQRVLAIFLAGISHSLTEVFRAGMHKDWIELLGQSCTMSCYNTSYVAYTDVNM